MFKASSEKTGTDSGVRRKVRRTINTGIYAVGRILSP